VVRARRREPAPAAQVSPPWARPSRTGWLGLLSVTTGQGSGPVTTRPTGRVLGTAAQALWLHTLGATKFPANHLANWPGGPSPLAGRGPPCRAVGLCGRPPGVARRGVRGPRGAERVGPCFRRAERVGHFPQGVPLWSLARSEVLRQRLERALRLRRRPAAPAQPGTRNTSHELTKRCTQPPAVRPGRCPVTQPTVAVPPHG
jgi:hypothetical protein